SRTTLGREAAMFRPILALCLTAAATLPPSPSAAAFDRLRALEGEWSGTFEWSGARTGSGAMTVSYFVSGNGSALVETLSVDGKPTMTTVYHRDGTDLRMTHYCGAQNQPRLKADRIDLDRGLLDFEMVDITNLASPDAPHVDGFEMDLHDPNR